MPRLLRTALKSLMKWGDMDTTVTVINMSDKLNIVNKTYVIVWSMLHLWVYIFSEDDVF